MSLLDKIANYPLAQTRYDHIRFTPIVVESAKTSLPPTLKNKMLSDFQDKGVAIVKVQHPGPEGHDVAWLASELNLGPAIVPDYYAVMGKNVHMSPRGINRVGGPKGAGNHSTFSTKDNDLQPDSVIHTDGTTEPLGRIITSLLLCEHQAVEGGFSTYFNSTGAFVELAGLNESAAEALLNEKAMTRFHPSDPSHPVTGPVYRITETGELQDVATLDKKTTRFNFEDVPNLNVAVEFLEKAAQQGSQWYGESLMQPGEIEIMANMHISHGRTAYKNGDMPRTMWRGLYERAPTR